VTERFPAGRIAAGKSRTVAVRVRFRLAGKIKAAFAIRSSNAGSRSARKTVPVRRQTAIRRAASGSMIRR
jgi:hypothetical protein